MDNPNPLPDNRIAPNEKAALRLECLRQAVLIVNHPSRDGSTTPRQAGDVALAMARDFQDFALGELNSHD